VSENKTFSLLPPPPKKNPQIQKNSDILSSTEGKAVIRQYNRIAYVLVEFEVAYHTAWFKEVSQLQYGTYQARKWGSVSNKSTVLMTFGLLLTYDQAAWLIKA
jgi:hypothetical protein